MLQCRQTCSTDFCKTLYLLSCTAKNHQFIISYLPYYIYILYLPYHILLFVLQTIIFRQDRRAAQYSVTMARGLMRGREQVGSGSVTSLSISAPISFTPSLVSTPLEPLLTPPKRRSKAKAVSVYQFQQLQQQDFHNFFQNFFNNRIRNIKKWAKIMQISLKMSDGAIF